MGSREREGQRGQGLACWTRQVCTVWETLQQEPLRSSASRSRSLPYFQLQLCQVLCPRQRHRQQGKVTQMCCFVFISTAKKDNRVAVEDISPACWGVGGVQHAQHLTVEPEAWDRGDCWTAESKLSNTSTKQSTTPGVQCRRQDSLLSLSEFRQLWFIHVVACRIWSRFADPWNSVKF